MKEILDNIGVILGSGIFGSLITLLFTRYDKDKSIIIKNITQERQKWRKKIRKLAFKINKNSLNGNWDKVTEARSQIQTLINPYDKNDINIIDNLVSLEVNKDFSTLQEINDGISRLLKHDWERVKKETTFFITAKGLMLASFVVAFIGSLLWRSSFFVRDMTLLNVTFLMAFILSTPILYQLVLSGLLWFLSLTKIGAKSAPLIYWLKDKPYRHPMKNKKNQYEVTVDSGNNKETKYNVAVKKLS